jgi:hypothetical protein
VEASVMGNATALPAMPEPDPIERVTLCPNEEVEKGNRLASIKIASLTILVT